MSEAPQAERQRSPQTIEFRHVVLRFGELVLKRNNRGYFENMLLRNVAMRLREQGSPRIERNWARLVVGPVEDPWRVAKACTEVFGLANVSPAAECEATPESICEVAIGVVEHALARRRDRTVRFRVTVRRADKSFPLNTPELQRLVGAELLAKYPNLVVDLHEAEVDVGIDVRHDGCFVFAERLPAAGGLPVGTSGRVLALLSGGIDSPVAAWQMLRRGCTLDFVHFDAQPFTGPGSLEKVKALAKRLFHWQPRGRLFVVPFAEIQVATKDIPHEGYRTIIGRRFMLRIAERLARRSKAEALVTGDSIGQVASQTLANLRTADDVVEHFPVMRPLLTFDKQDVIDRAVAIGTYDISLRPFEDCCTMMTPARPITRGNRAAANAMEEGLDIEALVEAAVKGTKKLERDEL